MAPLVYAEMAHGIFGKGLQNHSTVLTWPPDQAGRLNMTNIQEQLLRSESRIPDSLRARIMRLEKKRGWGGREARAIRKSACIAAVEFADLMAKKAPQIGLPFISPSKRGAVTLTWRIGETSFFVRIFSANPARIYFQREDPGFIHHSGTEERGRVINRLLALAKSSG